METNEFEIVTPIESGIDFITSDKVADNDVLLLWDVDAQQWKNFTINSLQAMGINQAQYLSHHILFDKTSDLSKVTGELSYNGIDNVNVITYEPDQSLNTNNDVTFSSVTVDEGIFADYDLLLESQTITLRANNIRFLNKDGTKAAIDMDVKGDVYGNANSANKVNHDFSILSTTAYTSASVGTLTFNGLENIQYWVYKPNQDVNTNANVTFKTVTADKFTGDLDGNAKSADKVNTSLTVRTLNTLETPTVISFDGSTAKSISIYTPNQEVNVTSTVNFNKVIVNELESKTGLFNGIVEIEKPYYLLGNVQGNATSADKVNTSLTQEYTNKISEVTNKVKFDGSIAKTIKTYRPNQDVNSTDDVTFKSTTADTIKTPDLEIINITGNKLGDFKNVDGRSVLTANEVVAKLTGNADTADKVNNAVTVNMVDSKTGTSLSSTTFDGSKAQAVTIKQYDEKISDMDQTDSNLNEAIEAEVKRASDAEAELQRQINNTNETVAGITSFEYEKRASFDDLPEVGTKGVIYLVPRNPGKDDDIYTEYIYQTTNGKSAYESIGVTAAELSDYVLTTTLTAYQTLISEEQKAQDEALAAEVKARTDDITEVKGLISTEAETRDQEYQELVQLIGDEGKARENADTDLQTHIDDEAKTRKDADDKLQENIDTEAETRETNDNTLQQNIDDLVFIKDASLEKGNTKDVLTLTKRDNSSVTVDVQHALVAGDNIDITDNVITATDTIYTAGDHIAISEDNIISGTYECATEESDGLMSKDDKKLFDTMNDKFNVYTLVADKDDGHKITLVGTGGKNDTTSTVFIPDNDHKYTLSIDEQTRKLTITGKLSDDDENPLVSTVTLPDDDTRYALEIYDHEFYMFTHKQHEEYMNLGLAERETYIQKHIDDGTLLHTTLPDNDHEYKAGNGISIDKDTGVISTIAADNQFIAVDELPTTNIIKNAIYLLAQYTVEDEPKLITYKLYRPIKEDTDTSTTWVEIGKQQENEIASNDDIDALFNVAESDSESESESPEAPNESKSE